MKKMIVLAIACSMAVCVSARPGPGPGGHGPRGGHPAPMHTSHGGHHNPWHGAPRHHHHSSTAWGIGAGVLGAGLVASAIYNATHPSTVVVEPAPVVVSSTPVVVQPAVVTAGHYETRLSNVWIEGRYVDQYVNGVLQRVWQPGHYEQRQTQVWVTP